MVPAVAVSVLAGLMPPAIGLVPEAHRRLAAVVTEIDIRLAGGRTLHAYDTRADGNAH